MLTAPSRIEIEPTGPNRHNRRTTTSSGPTDGISVRPTGATGAARLRLAVARNRTTIHRCNPSERRSRNGTLRRLIHSRARGGERMVRRHQLGARVACRARCCAPLGRGRRRTGLRVFVVAAGQQASAAAAGIVPPSKPSVDVTPQVMPHCTTHHRRRHERGLHRFRAAQHQLRPLARGPRAHGPAERLRHRFPSACSS